MKTGEADFRTICFYMSASEMVGFSFHLLYFQNYFQNAKGG